MRAQARERFRKVGNFFRMIFGITAVVARRDNVREAAERANDILDTVAPALDPHEARLRDEYGVDPDMPRGRR